MKIQIESVDKQNDLIEMSIEPYWTVSWLKALLVKETNEPMALQHLFFNGKELENNVEICRGVPSDARIFLVVDPDPQCALVTRMDNLINILKDVSKARMFKKI